MTILTVPTEMWLNAVKKHLVLFREYFIDYEYNGI